MTENGDATRRSTPWLVRGVQVVGMATAAFLLGAHTVKWAAVRVDVITLGLLGMLLIVPLIDLIRKIKVGEFEAEIGRAEIARAQAKVAVELPPSADVPTGLSEELLRQLLGEDPRLALAKVRIEVEEALKRLYASAVDGDVNWRRLSLGGLVDGLVQRGVLSAPLASGLRDVISLANRAVHGDRVEPKAAEELTVLGVRLVRQLHELAQELRLPTESLAVDQAEVDRYRSAQYRVTTIVPLLEGPKRNTYLFDQDGLDSFLEGYEEYAEFVVRIEKR